MVFACTSIFRGISTTAIRDARKHSPRHFLLFNKAGNRLEKERRAKDPNAEIDLRGLRLPGFKKEGKWIFIKEMVPELVVPSLEGFKLKPYVSYTAQGIHRKEFTAKDLFEVVYAGKIREDFREGSLKPDGEPVNPSEYEQLTPEEAKIRAAQTGTDIFVEELKPTT